MGRSDGQETDITGSEYYAEVIPMTFGKFRIIWTDGKTIDDGW